MKSILSMILTVYVQYSVEGNVLLTRIASKYLSFCYWPKIETSRLEKIGNSIDLVRKLIISNSMPI